MTGIPAGRVYTVEPKLSALGTQCKCGWCGWRGPESDLMAITDYYSVPPSRHDVAGRCPMCSALAYVDDNPVDRLAAVLNAARSLKDSAEALKNENAKTLAAFQQSLDRIIRIALGEKP